MEIEHPIVAAIAFLLASPVVWPVIKAFLISLRRDDEDFREAPISSWLTWYPEYPAFKLICTLLILASFTTLFYKVFVFFAGFLGFI